MKETCLYERHVAQGAQMSPFGGFIMPIVYTDIADEHRAVREHCGVFDVSHMGEIVVIGPDAERWVQHIFTNDVAGAPVGKIFYGMMCYDDGGTVDDLLVYVMSFGYLLVVNAANIDKDWMWMNEHLEGFNVNLFNLSDQMGQLAVQGPEAETVVEEVLGLHCKELTFYTTKTLVHEDGKWVDKPLPIDGSVLSDERCSSRRKAIDNHIIVSRTGYTGEDGFEIYASHEHIVRAWDMLMASGRCKPCGLGCRDTLRFEVGLPLYGDELSADISPLMAGLGIFVKLDKADFVGREALARQKAEGVSRKLVGIELQSKAIARHGYPVVADGRQVGEVTTGYRTISTDKSVCMALVETAYAQLGTPLEVQIRKKTVAGTVVKKKFYEKHYKK